MSRLTTDVQEFKSSFKLVISQVSVPRSLPSPPTQTHWASPPVLWAPRLGEEVGEGLGEFWEERCQGSVQGQDKLFLSCSEILPPPETFPRTQTRAFPGPACQKQNRPGPQEPGTLVALRMNDGFYYFTDVLSSSTLLALWLLDHARHQPTASVSRAEREAHRERKPCPQTVSSSPFMPVWLSG